MGKKKSHYPETLNLRLTVQQRAFLDDLCKVHDISPSDMLRGLVESARVDLAIETIDRSTSNA